MKKTILVLIVVLCFSVVSYSGEVISNNTSKDAIGLRVIFSTPVLITAFGDILRSVDRTDLTYEFVFSGGTVRPSGSHWLSWAPATVQIMSYEWLVSIPGTTAPLNAAFFFAPTVPSTLDTVRFVDSSADSDGSISSWRWNFGDGWDSSSAERNPGHRYTEEGTFTVTLTVTDSDGLTDSVSKTVTIRNLLPTASFTWQVLSSAGTRLVVEPRIGDRIEFDASDSSDFDGAISTYSWDWDSNGSYDLTTADPVIEHTFSMADSHRVTLRVADNAGATATVTKTVSIGAKQSPNAAFFFAPTVPSTLDTVRFVDSSADPDEKISSWAWNFGADSWSTERNPSHRFTKTGTFTVQLTVTDNDGITDSTTRTVTIKNLPPMASFTWQALSSSGTRLVVEPRTGNRIEFDASASSDLDGEIVTYSWDWESNGHYDSTTADPVIEHTFSTAGSHRITLRVIDDAGATATVTKTLSIGETQPPNAAFSLTPASASILDTVQFTDSSTDPDGSISSWYWSFGDGASSTDRNPSHRFTDKGTFIVQLTVTDSDGLTDSTTRTVTVRNLLPDAQFSYQPETVRMDQALFFDAAASSDLDGEIVAYDWDFNTDGESDALGLLMEWIYTEPGTYTVRLTVTDDDGTTASHEAFVTVAAVAEIIEPAEVWALVIGISDYQDPAVKDLDYARADAEAFTRWLLDSGVNPDHIVLLLDEVGEWPELDGITSQLATLTKVRSGIDWLRRMALPDDLVFVFFAGHGYQGEDDDGDETDGVDEFLVLYDAERDALEATTLRDDEFGRFLDRVESNHVMVVFDSCHSGGQDRSLSGGARPLGDEFDIFNDFSLEGRLILAAAQEDQQALEDAGLGHGLFTYFLLEGLEGAADLDLDHQITADELYTYVSDEVEQFARQEKGREQIPEMTGRGEVGIVLSRTNRPPTVAFTVGPDIPYACGLTRFTDASTDDTQIVGWEWDLGDGSTAAETNPTHVYEQPGTYIVTLTVTDDEGETSTMEQELVIAPPGEVTVIAGDTIIISLGSVNGIQVGDRFEVLRILELMSGHEMIERKASIEVIENLGPNRSACQIEEQWFPIELHDLIYPAE